MTKKKLTRLKAVLCDSCRSRKVKCDLEIPCKTCVRLGIECIRAPNDKRKERYLNEYVEKLQQRITALENVINNVRSAVNLEGSMVKTDFENEDTDEAEAPSETPVTKTTIDNSKYIHPQNFANLDKNDNLAVYGPTSVFDSESINKETSNSYVEDIKKLNQDGDIITCIKSFFTWQYPDHNIFLFREAFVIDFFNPKLNSSYCSVELVYAICALGARMVDDERIFSKSLRFFQEAKKLTLEKLAEPSIPSMQSFLLLAFYEICSGNNSSGWMLSGNGIRMGFDLGFQLDPETWFLKSNEKISSLNIAIRSRIFWGCYLADHFISLLLGRPSILKMSDTSVPETDDLPDIDWIYEYSYVSPDSKDYRDSIVYISTPLKSIISLINISADMLTDVFTRDEDEKYTLSLKFDKLSYYNSRILAWKSSLPSTLQWDQAILKKTAENPTVNNTRYYYYILLLCLNRPFIEVSKQAESQDSPSSSPSRICNEVIDDLMIAIERFRLVHGLRKASIFIVYCSILSVSVIILSKSKQTTDLRSKITLTFFMNVLHGCSKTWKLAEKSYKLVEQKLEKDHGVKLSIFDDQVVIDSPLESFDSPSLAQTPSMLPNSDALGVFDNNDFFGGPPLLMTSDLFDQNWESLFPH